MTTNSLANFPDRLQPVANSDTPTIPDVPGMHRQCEESQVVISVVVPTRNEAQHIHSCLRSLVHQTFPCGKYEVLVADGRSTDNSRDIVALFQNRDVHVKLLDNSARTTPTGMNLGIRSAVGEVIVIAGAHTIYPDDFLENCVRWLHKTGADVVGGPVTTRVNGENFGSRLACRVLSSPFGVGNSHFRTSYQEGYVDTVPFGAYRRAILQQVGLFNERLTRNQDNDLSARIRDVGGKIFLTPALTTTYIPAGNFFDVVRQAFQKSQWHIFTLKENRRALGWRHFCPAIFVAVACSLSLVALEHSIAQMLLAFLLSLYFAAGFYTSIRSRWRDSGLLTILMPFACFAFHCAYGLGTLVGFQKLIVWRSRIPPANE